MKAGYYFQIITCLIFAVLLLKPLHLPPIKLLRYLQLSFCAYMTLPLLPFVRHTCIVVSHSATYDCTTTFVLMILGLAHFYLRLSSGHDDSYVNVFLLLNLPVFQFASVGLTLVGFTLTTVTVMAENYVLLSFVLIKDI